MQGVLRFVKFKEKELNEIIDTVKEKNSHITEKDEEIIGLKKTIVSLRRDVFEADQKRISQMSKLKEVREIYSNVMKDKQFYLTKIQDQRNDIKYLNKQGLKKDAIIDDLRRQLTEQENQNKLDKLKIVKELAYTFDEEKQPIDIVDEEPIIRDESTLPFLTEPPVPEQSNPRTRNRSLLQNKQYFATENGNTAPHQ